MEKKNYFNAIPWREALQQLGHCRFMDRAEFSDGTSALKGKKIVIVGCGAQGLNQGLNLRDSGLDVSYALRESAITEKRQSYKNAIENGFKVGTYEELIPQADLVGNLTPDKQHSNVLEKVIPLMKKGSALWYSHGFNIVEEGMQIRPDITVVMMAPKGPGSEVRTEYQRGFGIPTLIAVHPVNDPEGKGWAIAKALAVGTGGSRAGVLPRRGAACRATARSVCRQSRRPRPRGGRSCHRSAPCRRAGYGVGAASRIRISSAPRAAGRVVAARSRRRDRGRGRG